MTSIPKKKFLRKTNKRKRMPNRTPQVPWGLELLCSIDLMISRLSESGSQEGTSRFAELVLSRREATSIMRCAPFLLDYVLEVGGKAHSGPDLGHSSARLRVREASPHVLYYMRGWLEVLFDFDLKLPLLFRPEEFEKTWRRMNDWDLNSFVSFAKYFVVYPMARFLKNPLPTTPIGLTGGPLLFTGAVKRYLKNRIVSYNIHNAGLMQGILQGVKRATKVVPDTFIKSAFLKHKKTLSEEYFFDFGFLGSFETYCERFCKKFNPPKVTLFEGSPSASYEASRSEGGQREYVLGLVSETGLDRRSFSGKIEDGQSSLSFSQMTKMKEISSSLVEEVRRLNPPPVTSVMGDVVFDLPRSWLETNDPSYTYYPPSERFFHSASIWSSEDYHFLSFRVSENLWHESEKYESWAPSRALDATVSAVLEPLKVRLITKGPSVPYWVSRFFQKSMWDYLRRFPPFRLIGKKLEHSDLDKLYQQLISPNMYSNFFQFWVSGDYSAATDGLKGVYTKVAFESFLRQVPFRDSLRNLLRSVLYEHRLHYPSNFNLDHELDSFLQVTGQLMGSTLSFPILCLVNFIAYQMSMDRYARVMGIRRKRVGIWDLPVLVNGDDILFPSNMIHYTIWLQCIKEVGFSLSLGKNYCSPNFLTVNSELYFFSSGVFRYVKYLNAGLLTGQSKLNSDREKIQNKPIWAIQQIVNRGAYSPSRTYGRFVHYHLRDIESFTNHGEFNVFIHPMLGGLGFDLPEGVDFSFTSWQAKVALYLREYLLQPIKGRGLRTTHFWKGVVTKTSRLAEPVHSRYLEIEPFKGQGPLNENIVLFEELSPMEAILTGFWDTAKPVWGIKMLPQAIVKAVRLRYPVPLKDPPRPEKLLSFPYRFVYQVVSKESLDKAEKSIQSSISLGYEEDDEELIWKGYRSLFPDFDIFSVPTIYAQDSMGDRAYFVVPQETKAPLTVPESVRQEGPWSPGRRELDQVYHFRDSLIELRAPSYEFYESFRRLRSSLLSFHLDQNGGLL